MGITVHLEDDILLISLLSNRGYKATLQGRAPYSQVGLGGRESLLCLLT